MRFQGSGAAFFLLGVTLCNALPHRYARFFRPSSGPPRRRWAGEGRGDWRGQGITVARLFWCFNAGPGLRLCLAPAGKVVWFFAHDVGCKAVSRPRGQGGPGVQP